MYEIQRIELSILKAEEGPQTWLLPLIPSLYDLNGDNLPSFPPFTFHWVPDSMPLTSNSSMR